MHGYIYIYTYAYICTYTYMYIYMHMHTCIYILLHNSCMRACTTVQQLPCHGSYCELILSLARTSCRLSCTARPPADRPPAGNLSPDPVRFKNPSTSTLAHDAVAAAVLHTHHPIIRIDAGLIQFVYGLHSRLATGGNIYMFIQP